jgi:hypothetical protein
MIYPTLKECLEECERTGTLNYSGLEDNQYMKNKIGFIPRLVKESI